MDTSLIRDLRIEAALALNTYRERDEANIYLVEAIERLIEAVDSICDKLHER